tara:strand:+ start:1073 stop:1468 length:396 start_codon:yes stop_codon:yes gene_type:complete
MSAITKAQNLSGVDLEICGLSELDIILHPVINLLRTDQYIQSSTVDPMILTRKIILNLNIPDIKGCISQIVKELNYSKIPGSEYHIFTNILNALALTATFIMMKLKKTTSDDKSVLNNLKERVIESWKLVE